MGTLWRDGPGLLIRHHKCIVCVQSLSFRTEREGAHPPGVGTSGPCQWRGPSHPLPSLLPNPRPSTVPGRPRTPTRVSARPTLWGGPSGLLPLIGPISCSFEFESFLQSLASANLWVSRDPEPGGHPVLSTDVKMQHHSAHLSVLQWFIPVGACLHKPCLSPP